jgi:hypothetical protein
MTAITEEGISQFLELAQCNGYRFFYLSTKTCDTLYEAVSRDGVLLLLYVARTVAIALLLSVIMVKLLSHKDLFAMRPRICLAPTKETDAPGDDKHRYWEKQGGWELRCRLYNATPLTLLNLKFNAKLRRPIIKDHDWLLKNKTINLATQSWAVALPYVPLSIRIALNRAKDLDIDYREESESDKPLLLKRIQGHKFFPKIQDPNNKAKNAKSFLVINIEGAIDEADKSLIESLWWPITNDERWYDQGREYPVKVQPGEKPLKTGSEADDWDDWDKFEVGVIDNYVFGYGSLMEEWLDKEPFHIANLKGFERDWKATMDNTLEISGYKNYDAESSQAKPRHVSFLNISKGSKSAEVTGVVRRLSLWQLAMLDHRERNYLRIEVTDKTQFIGTPPSRPFMVWTYTASQASLARFKDIEDMPVVSQSYYEKHQRGWQRIEQLASADKPLKFGIKGKFTTQKLDQKWHRS